MHVSPHVVPGVGRAGGLLNLQDTGRTPVVGKDHEVDLPPNLGGGHSERLHAVLVSRPANGLGKGLLTAGLKGPPFVTHHAIQGNPKALANCTVGQVHDS